jgi:gamma-glutamylcyclotransferase (GGCT)/AIG2-like uncharacterized protein YtfP
MINNREVILMKYIVFVYGTLKRDFPNHYVLGDSKFLGEFTTEPRYTMLDLGMFPGVIYQGNTKIVGEVFEVDEKIMTDLDNLEGFPTLYGKHNLKTEWGTAIMYIYNITEYNNEFINVDVKIEDGIWIEELEF